MMLGSCSFSTQRLTERPDGPGNDWSCVILNFGTLAPVLSMVSCLMQPKGASEAFGMLNNILTWSGSANPCATSSDMLLIIASLYFAEDL